MPNPLMNIVVKLGDKRPTYQRDIIPLMNPTVVITEKGKRKQLPVIDLQMIDGDGHVYYIALTTESIYELTNAIEGVNRRNHGESRPTIKKKVS